MEARVVSPTAARRELKHSALAVEVVFLEEVVGIYT
jgi:hypothetical protein